MSATKPRSLLRIEYANAAEAYLRSLPPEHFMEATAQATQREITVESLALVKAHRPDVHYFNELLVQYPVGRGQDSSVDPAPVQQIRQVVPDNLVVVCDEPIVADGSFDVPFQPVGPFWVLEYVSKHNKRKDYEQSFQKYERDLKVPYFLLFYPEGQELSLYHHTGKKYKSVTANSAERFAIQELDLELALRDEWVRFWFRGELLPLPADLQCELDQTRAQLKQARAQLKVAQDQAEHARSQAEQERQQKDRLLAQLKQLGIEPE